MTPKQKLLHLNDILNSEVWLECASKTPGAFPGETLVESMRREHAALQYGLSDGKALRLRCNMTDVEGFVL